MIMMMIMMIMIMTMIMVMIYEVINCDGPDDNDYVAYNDDD